MAQKRKSLKKSFRKNNRSTRRKSKTNKRKSKRRGGDASDTIKNEVDDLNNLLNPTTHQGKKISPLPENDTNIKNQLEKILGSHIFSRCSGDANCEAKKTFQYQEAKSIIERYIEKHPGGLKEAYLKPYIPKLNAKIKAHTNLTDNTQSIE